MDNQKEMVTGFDNVINSLRIHKENYEDMTTLIGGKKHESLPQINLKDYQKGKLDGKMELLEELIFSTSLSIDNPVYALTKEEFLTNTRRKDYVTNESLIKLMKEKIKEYKESGLNPENRNKFADTNQYYFPTNVSKT